MLDLHHAKFHDVVVVDGDKTAEVLPKVVCCKDSLLVSLSGPQSERTVWLILRAPPLSHAAWLGEEGGHRFTERMYVQYTFTLLNGIILNMKSITRVILTWLQFGFSLSTHYTTPHHITPHHTTPHHTPT